LVTAVGVHLVLLFLFAIWVVEERLIEDVHPVGSQGASVNWVIVCSYPRPKLPRVLKEVLKARDYPRPASRDIPGWLRESPDAKGTSR